ncbi:MULTISPECIES: hypothetical protein [Methylobacterium]|uniref:hypothetical protein n=1 Tax=Methylobacterium TaxID=407 RepID=UPI001EE358D1|nr:MULTISPECIES: hypothetical protein [Methylobacterium]
MKITNLIDLAISKSMAEFSNRGKEWLILSFRLGGLLPKSLLVANLQRVSQFDMLICAMERELIEDINSGNSGSVSSLSMLSALWIADLYEVMRVMHTNERNHILEHTVRTDRLYRKIENLRIALCKHEIAKDAKIKGSIAFKAFGDRDADQTYIYDKSDGLRSHIMPCGISLRGSLCWQAVDGRTSESEWLERRYLADEFLLAYQASQMPASAEP